MRVRTVAVVAATLVVAWVARGMFTGGVPVDVVAVGHGPIREYVDEEGKTRLPRTYLITMPFEGRILPIELEEGDRVAKGQVVARVVPEDLSASAAEAEAAVARLVASIRESADTSVERTALAQSLSFLASMDRTVEAAKEQVKAGQAKREFAGRVLDRVRALHERHAASAEDLNRAEVDQVQANVEYQQDILIARAVESLRAATALLPTAVEQYIARKGLRVPVLEQEKAEAEARLAQVRLRQRRGTMISPVDGVVLRREVIDERHLAAGTTLLEIGQLDELEVEADVLSQEAVRIAPGQAVDISGPAIGAPAARGIVRRIEPAGFTKVSSLGVEQQRVTIIVAFKSSDLVRLRAADRLGVGYRVQVRITTASKSDAVIVPRSVLFRGPAGDWRVYVVQEGRARVHTVRVGLRNDGWAEIVRGLAKGDHVIPAPEADLVDGIRVRPIAASPPNPDEPEAEPGMAPGPGSQSG